MLTHPPFHHSPVTITPHCCCCCCCRSSSIVQLCLAPATLPCIQFSYHHYLSSVIGAIHELHATERPAVRGNSPLIHLSSYSLSLLLGLAANHTNSELGRLGLGRTLPLTQPSAIPAQDRETDRSHINLAPWRPFKTELQ